MIPVSWGNWEWEKKTRSKEQREREREEKEKEAGKEEGKKAGKEEGGRREQEGRKKKGRKQERRFKELVDEEIKECEERRLSLKQVPAAMWFSQKIVRCQPIPIWHHQPVAWQGWCSTHDSIPLLLSGCGRFWNLFLLRTNYFCDWISVGGHAFKKQRCLKPNLFISISFLWMHLRKQERGGRRRGEEVSKWFLTLNLLRSRWRTKGLRNRPSYATVQISPKQSTLVGCGDSQ